ncbi:Protein of unknown function [Actinacidiphila yanglinensis]|uniref:DUF3040 domain-containing protein n=1 Tax=Actinacidiphila yanglinensis TaxID=310779 RepID=A0A1H6DHD2_9ACTN|nr:DUF3040 domain-containing protein [Actinacidiphila yanglinensis]SEG84857.1 Protein of unknown function [Actinacidiphila yanglinensis]
MGLTVRELRVLRDIEQTLARDDPCLARQLSSMALTPAAGKGEQDDEQYAEDSRPGGTARRLAKWCGALTLVLLAVSDLLVSTEVFYAAGGAAVAALASWLVARAAAHGKRRAPART